MNTFEINGVKITWLGHASFRIENDVVIYIDPYVLDENPKKADIILTTHEHFDHHAKENFPKIAKEDTEIISPCEGTIVKPGDVVETKGVKIEVVEAYNVDKPFHPKGLGVGFVIEINGVRIYHAGDTDRIPEMKELKNIDVALLPIGGKYTMDIDQAVEAVRDIKPKIVIPMHYNYLEETKANPEEFKEKVGDTAQVVILG
jgi:L-ascorbate metabolism protein UlaG (beta-lactamase superfamily)